MRKSTPRTSVQPVNFSGIESLESRWFLSGTPVLPSIQTGASLSGTLYADLNGHGQAGAPVAGRQVYLDLQGIDVVTPADPIAMTDANGNYTFTNLPASNYIIRVVPVSGQVTTVPVWGGKYFVQLGLNQAVTGENFLVQTVSTPSLKLSNGMLIVTGMSNGQATLARFNPDGSFDTTYGTLGILPIPNVLAQATKMISLPDGTVSITYPTQTVILTTSGVISSVSTSTGSVSAPTGLAATATITTVTLTFNDTSTNEQSFTVERAASASGPWSNVGSVAGTTTTGSRTFTDSAVTSGTIYFYRVYGISGAIQSGVAGPVSVTTGSVVTPGATIRGMVFSDTNGNGAKDAGELSIAGQQIYLDLQGIDALAAGDPIATTDANGNYSFTNLTAGNYLVRPVPQNGHVTMSPFWGGKYFVQAAKGQSIGGEDFGIQTVTAPSFLVLGRLLVAGTKNGLSTLARFNADGSIDIPFGGNGTVTLASTVTGQPTGATGTPDGKSVITYLTQVVTLDAAGNVLSIVASNGSTTPPSTIPAAGAGWVPYAQLLGQDVAANNFPKINGSGITVAVIDRGIDYNSPQIGANKILYQYNFRDGNTNGLDDYGHGTGVTGIIAGSGFTFNGQYDQGVAPGVNLVDLKQESSAGVKAALDWVIVNHTAYNIQVVNITDFITDVLPGAWNPSIYLPELKTIHDLGIFISTPVGNGEAIYGPNVPIDNPALSPYVTGVGGFNLSGQFYADSKRGPGLQILGPASNVTMLYYQKNAAITGFDQFDDNYTGTPIITNYGAGTSWASSYVAGAAALLKQISSSLTPDQIQQIMKDSGTPVLDPTNNVYYSRLNINNAIQLTYQRLGITP